MPINSPPSLTCDYCIDSEHIGAGPWGGANSHELDFNATIAECLPDIEIEETLLLTCSNCAAQVEFNPNTPTTKCPLYATSVASDTGVNRHIKSRGVLPVEKLARMTH